MGAEKNFYHSHLNISFECNQFLIRTIHHSQDLYEILKLREKCFHWEQKQPSFFDLLSEHLVVVDQNTKKICGAYRVTCSNFSSVFEASDDFDIQRLLNMPGNKIELAWVCIDPDFRSNLVVGMLWRGLSEIFKVVNPRYVFGLTTVTPKSVEDLAGICEIFGKEYCLPMDFGVTPRIQKTKPLTYQLEKTFFLDKQEVLKKKVFGKIPHLLRAYLLAGALVCAMPTFDPDLNAYDFLTVLDMDLCADQVVHHFGL